MLALLSPPPPEGNSFVSTLSDIKPVVVNEGDGPYSGKGVGWGGQSIGVFDGKPDSVVAPETAYQIVGFSEIAGSGALRGPSPVVLAEEPKEAVVNARRAISKVLRLAFDSDEKVATIGKLELHILQRAYDAAARFNEVHSVKVVKHPIVFSDIAKQIAVIAEAVGKGKDRFLCGELLDDLPPQIGHDNSVKLSDGSVITESKHGRRM